MHSFDISDLPKADERTPADWVKFYARVENAVAMGQHIQIGDWKVSTVDLTQVRASLEYWKDKAAEQAVPAGRPKRGPLYLRF